MSEQEDAYMSDFINKAKSGYMSLFVNLADNFNNCGMTLDDIKLLKEFHTNANPDKFNNDEINLSIGKFLNELDKMTKKLEFSTHIIVGVISGMNKLIDILLENSTNDEMLKLFINTKSVGNILQDIIELLEADSLSFDKIEELAIRASTRTAIEVRRILKEGVGLDSESSALTVADNNTSVAKSSINKSNMAFPIFDNDLALLEESLRKDGWVELG